MGCLFTKHTARVVAASMSDPDEYYLQFNLMAFRRPFNAIGIRDIDIMQLHYIFREIDEDDSKTLSIKEFFDYFHFQFISPMGKRIFSLFDADNSGDLDFGEFAICCWNYCSLNDIRMLKFTFDLYDMDENKVMDVSELQFMMKEAYGSKRRMDNNTLETLNKFIRKNQTEDVLWKKMEFCHLCVTNRSLFWPLFVLRDEMRRKILGEKFWGAVLKQREEKYDTTKAGDDQNGAKVLRRRIQAVQGEIAGGPASKRRHGNFKAKIKAAAGHKWEDMSPAEKQRFAARKRIEDRQFQIDSARRKAARQKALAKVRDVGFFGSVKEDVFEDDDLQ